ncbi:MAG: hypothetical protein O9972_27035, partial [Burkholderiales bacterium]|nr:hypothetical protein [Burkholderiales bacterium]
LIAGYEDFDSRPVLIEVEGGVRIPCREVSLTCRTISDPKIGIALDGFWLKLDQTMRTDADLIPVADLIKASIEGPSGLTDWQTIMAGLGWSREAMVATGLAPADATALVSGTAADPAELAEIEIDPADLTVVSAPGESLEAP